MCPIAWTAGITKANGDLFLYTEFNNFVGASGNLFETAVAKATAAGQIPYSTGATALALLASGPAGQFLRSGGAAPPTWAPPAASELGNTRRCSAYRSAVFAVATATWTTIPLDAELSDPDGWHSLVTNTSRITVAAAGLVLVFGQAMFAPNATGIRIARILYNGTTILAQAQRSSNGASLDTPCDVGPVIKPIAANDYFEIQGYQASGGDLNVVGAQSDSYLHAILLPGTG